MAFCVSNSHSVSFYSNILDLWLLWCDNSDLDLLNLCPKTPLLCPKLVYHYPRIFMKKIFFNSDDINQLEEILVLDNKNTEVRLFTIRPIHQRVPPDFEEI